MIQDLEEEEIRQASAVPTQEEVEQIILRARTHIRDFLLLRILYLTGLRRAEAVALLVGDILWDTRSLFVRSGKGDKDRYVLLDRVTIQLLKEYLGDAPPQRRVFPHTGKWVHDTFLIYAGPTRIIEKYAALGLRLSPHSLRFAFGTHFYDNGLDFARTTALLGHTLPQDSLFYIQSARQNLKKAYETCGPYAATEVAPPPTALACYHYPSLVSLGEIEREFASQPEAARRDRLPGAPTPAEVLQLLAASQENHEAYLFFRLLYSSGLWPGHTLELQRQHFQPDQRMIQLRTRAVFLDSETNELLQSFTRNHKADQCLFSRDEATLSTDLTHYASQTGLHQRAQAIQRPFTLETLRFAYAIHCCSQRMDPISLMTLLGLHYYGTFHVYNMCAMHRHLEAYDAATPNWVGQC